MQDFADMAEAHAWTLQRLREMAGRLTEQAYLRASKAATEQDDEAHARWMLVFDRMARGLRLSIALEAKLSRERRRDACEIEQEASGERREPRGRSGGAQAAEAEPRESDCEADDDGLPDDAPLGERIGRLKAIIAGTGACEPQAFLSRAERRAIYAQRGERARLAASPCPPDEPRDRLSPFERAEDYDPPWEGSG